MSLLTKLVDLITEHEKIQKSLVYYYGGSDYYYAVKDASNILDLGYTLPPEAEEQTPVEGTAPNIMLVYSKSETGDHKITCTIPSSDDDMLDIQADAVDLIENNSNNVMRVKVASLTGKTFAGRPIYRVCAGYEWVSKQIPLNMSEEDFIEEEQVTKAGTQTQSIIFPKSKYTVDQAKSWLKSHGKHAGKVDTTANYHRFRQFDPSLCTTTPKTISLGSSGIKAIICNKGEGDATTKAIDTPTRESKGEFEQVMYFSKIAKSDWAKGLVTGVVYEPTVKDSHGDFTSAEEIENACHEFMKTAVLQNVWTDIDHSEPITDGEVSVVESYIAPVNFDLNGQEVKKGTWVLVAQVNSPSLKKAISEGEITGFSLEGHALKIGD